MNQAQNSTPLNAAVAYKVSMGLLEKVICPICEKSEHSVLKESNYPPDVTQEDFLKTYCSSSDQKLMDRLVQCNSCSMVYLNPRVDSSIIMESYSNAEDAKFIEQNPERIETFKRNFSKILEQYPIQSKSAARVLDVGCAGGAFPEAVHQLGLSVVGIEPSEWLCKRGREMYGLDLRPGILKNQKFEEKSFDYVTLWDVIEHLTDPAKELKEILRVLSDDGYFIVNFPDHGSLARRLLGKKWPFFLSVHLYYFTPETMTTFLSQHGFEVLSAKPYWQTLPLGYVLGRAEKYFKFLSLFTKASEKLNIAKAPCTYNVGQTLIIARKKR